MKKLYLLIIFIFVMVFTISCGNALNPLFYNRGSKGSFTQELNKPEVEAPEDIPEDQDPFKKNEEYNSPDYGGFNANVFDKWLFQSSFREDKLPIYNFLTEDTRVWMPGGKDWNGISANYYNPRDKENQASGYGITGMTVYKYDAANPLYDNNGYLPGRMERFRFYSIQGEAVVVTLKQYLIAVDTYSKFIFAFGKITQTETVIGGDKVPTAFEAVEYHGDRHFYEYDPIGYVESDGSVVLYPHYQTEFVKAPTDYNPQVHGYPSMATHTPTGQGHSPYYVMSDAEAGEDDQQKYRDDINTLNGKTYKWRDYSGYQKSPTGEKDQINLEEWINSGYLGKSLILYTYSIGDNGERITVSQQEFQNSSVSSKDYYLSKITASDQAVYTNSQDGSSISVKITESNSKKTISVSGNILDENFEDYGPIFVDRAKNTKFVKSGSFTLSAFSSFVDTGDFTASITDMTYKFNENGTEFTLSFTYKGTGFGGGSDGYREYRFKLARFDSSAANTWTAKYECLDMDATLGSYTRVVLRNGSGTDNPGPNEVGTAIRSSMTLHSIDFAETPTINMGLDLYADRVE